MNRRSVLSAGAAAALWSLSGCAGGGSRRNESADSDRVPSDDFWVDFDELPTFREPTVVDFETASLTAAAVGHGHTTADGFSLRMDLRSGATADSPATVAAVVANTEPFAQPFEPGRFGLLEDLSSLSTEDDDRHTIYLAPTESHPLATTVPAHERDADGRWRLTETHDDWYPRRVTVGGKTGFVAEYYLLGSHQDDEPPIGAGRYRLQPIQETLYTIAAWPTTEPGPDEPSVLADRDPPPLPGEQPTAWYHEATPETETFLRPDTERVRPPEDITFDFVNHSRGSLFGNPLDWRLYKLVGGDWYRVAPWGIPLPAATVGPGGRFESELTVFHGKSPSSTSGRAVDYLGGGLYAYRVGFDEDAEHAAFFEFDAPALDVGIGSEAEVVETGATTVVELPEHVGAGPPTTFTVTAAPDAEPDCTLIPEQLPRRPFRALRNSLPLFEAGVESVRVRTNRSVALELSEFEADTPVVVQYLNDTYRTVGTLDE